MTVQDYFDRLIAAASGHLTGDEILLANYAGEETDFVRFNHGDVRQAGSVNQAELDLDLVSGQSVVRASIQVTLDADLDRRRIDDTIADLRDQMAVVGADPYLLYSTDVTSSEQVGGHDIPPSTDAVAAIRDAAAGRDLVGIYTSGRIRHGFANSLGQRNWFESSSFNFDWTFYLRADKAAKNNYAGFAWDDEAFGRRIEWSSRQLEVLDREPVDLKPGAYRTYLTPTAVHEVVDLLTWGGFGMQAHETMQTPLLHMVSEGATLAPGTTISEHTAGGVAPNFQEQGFIRPDEVVLIDDGRYVDTLVSPRSAREYGVETNGASAWESPESLSISTGALPADAAVEALDTGLYVGNLHYANYSDRSACRVTGLTRFATFWVDGGELAAPVNVLRFDDTVYRMLGENLVDRTDDVEVVLDPSSYDRRSTVSTRLPGALLEELRFTL